MFTFIDMILNGSHPGDAWGVLLELIIEMGFALLLFAMSIRRWSYRRWVRRHYPGRV